MIQYHIKNYEKSIMQPQYITDNQNYYPTYHSGLNPIHEVKNWCYVRSIVRAAMRGDDIPPIFIDGELHGGTLLAGTHRSAANDILTQIGRDDCLIDYVSYDDDIASNAMRDAYNNNDYDLIDQLWGDRDRNADYSPDK